MEPEKLKNKAKLLSILCLVISIGFFAFCLISLIRIRLDSGAMAASLVSSVLLCLLSPFIMFCAWRMLRSVSRGESPFTLGNVNLLRSVGWALIVFEAAQEISAQVVAHLFFRSMAEGESVSVVSSMGGLFFVVGLMLLGVASMFRYGIELQRQSDETL